MSVYPPLLWSVAAEGLRGTRLAHPNEPLSPANWQLLLSPVIQQRLVGLLSVAVEAGRFPLTPSQFAELAELDAETAALSLGLDRVLLEVTDTMQHHDVPVRVLKGAALAHLCYPDPRQRPYGDVDLLVPADRFDEAVRLLIADGGRAKFAEPRPGFIRRFGKGVSVRRPDGYEVDLHRTFVSGPFGMTVELADLFEGGTPFTVGGRELLGLGAEERFIHACYHAVLGSRPPRALPLRDVAQLALDPTLDVARVHRLIERWGAASIVAAAVAMAWRELQLADAGPLSAFAATYEPTRREARALSVYSSPPTQRYSRQSVAALASIPKVRDRAAYLAALLLPSRQYLADHDGGYVRRFVRAVRVFRSVEHDT